MGKRELVLIVVFVVLGVCVYQFTAPAPPPGSEDVSIGGIVNKLRRNIRGARETAPADWSQTTPVDPAIRELRINISRPNDLTVTGEERADIAIEVHAIGRGYDEAEAKATAATARLRVERAGDALVVGFDQGPQRGLPRNARLEQLTIVLKVPQRLALRVEPHFGRFTAANVASAEIMGSRGETRIRNTAGHLALSHTGGKLEIDGAGSLKLTGRNSAGSIARVNGTATLDLNGGELHVEAIVGPFDVEARNAELTIDAGKTAKPPFRFNGTGGQLRVSNLRTEARIDGRNEEIEVQLAAAAPVTIYSTGEDIVLVAPPAGYTLDAVATEGRLDIGDGTLKPAEDGESRVSGAVRGGGPTISLRATRGDITVRKPEGK
jgi:Putative adhesin